MALAHRVGWDARFFLRSPWFWPLRPAAQRFADRADWPQLSDYDALYADATHALNLPTLRFADNVRKRDKRVDGRVVLGALYDSRIALAREVPTRERDWHDFFNALCFATFPRSKLALHARQYHRMAARLAPEATRLPATRTPEQDALTLFDEGGVVLAAEPALACQLSAARGAFDRGRLNQWIDARRLSVVPFGHALFEHLVEGLRCPGGCTQVIPLPTAQLASADVLAAVDGALARVIADPVRLRSPQQCAQISLADALSTA